MKKNLLALGLIILAGGARAQAPAVVPTATPDTTDYARRYAATITPARLETHLRILASDEYEGRETGQQGQKMAAAYLARQFDAAGVPPPPGLGSGANPHYQGFRLLRTRWRGAELRTGKKDLTYLGDFYPVGRVGTTRALKLPVVFAAFGIAQESGSDYTGLDVRGRAVVVLEGEPTDARGTSRLGTGRNPRALDVNGKIATAAQQGAAAVIIISNRTPEAFEAWMTQRATRLRESKLLLPDPATDAAPAVPAVLVGPAQGAVLLGTTVSALTQYRQAVAREGFPLAAKEFDTKQKIRLRLRLDTASVGTENVLGYVEGSDKRDEVVVLSAHYDHLGKHDGQVFNGADDDGSGTTAVLAMAEAFAQAKRDGHGPRRSLLFLAVTGEEKGLLGSEFYTDHPVLPLAATVADLNTDMIGRQDETHPDPNYVYLIGDDKLASDLHRINETRNRRYTHLKLDYTFDDPADPNQFYYRSDHYNFARKGIPVAFYFNGVHADYHKETDEVSKILFPVMARRTQLVFHTAWELANREERLKVDSNKK